MESDTHITRLYEYEGGAPSFFELVAQDRLSTRVLHPAYKFLIHVIQNKYPNLIFIYKNSEKLFWTIITIMELYFLKTQNSSAAQYFYNLHLKHIQNNHKKKKKLSNKAILAAILYLVGGPLLRHKLETWYKNYQQNNLQNNQNTITNKIQKIAAHAFPYLWTIESTAVILTQTRYLIKSSSNPNAIWTPYYYILPRFILGPGNALYIASNTPLETVNQTALNPASSSSIIAAITAIREYLIMSSTTEIIRDSLLSAVRLTALASLHTLRFAQWWVNNEEQLQPQKVPLHIPPPPPFPKILCEGSNVESAGGGMAPGTAGPLPVDKSLCFICLDRKENPACTLSGAVGCYGCLVASVRQYGRCPLTGIPCDEKSIRRLFATPV